MSSPGNNRVSWWPWSWPVDVPTRVRIDRGIVHLTSRGVIYDMAANVGKGYEGVIVGDPDEASGLAPFSLTYKVGRTYLRRRLRSGEWTVVDDA